ncbi:MAG: class I SAM-dependent methyltransferase [Rhizomicrobium sp.]
MSDPVGIWDTIEGRSVQAREYRDGPCRYEAEPDWEAELHRTLGLQWPCPDRLECGVLWRRVVSDVAGAGIRVGPESFNGFNDADAALVRAIWCLARHLRPLHAVETGVAHGFTSRFILEAFARNGSGDLSSIDRPPLDPTMRSRIGVAVEDRSRWTLISGTSRRRLPALLARLGNIGLFVHDSLHTAENLLFELDWAWRHLGSGGALVVDDIDTNTGFRTFAATRPGQRTFVCEAEPVRPDHRRFNGKGLFGIILKGPV